MTLKFVIIVQNLIKAYHRKSGKSKYDRKLTELDVETARIRSRVNGVLVFVRNLELSIRFLFLLLATVFLNNLNSHPWLNTFVC